MKHILRIAALLAAACFLFVGCAQANSNAANSVSAAPIPRDAISGTSDGQTAGYQSDGTQTDVLLKSTADADLADASSMSDSSVRALSDTEHAASHDVRIVLDAKAHKLDIDHTITYRNQTGVPLESIYFNVVPVAFRADGGGTTIHEMLVDGVPVRAESIEQTVYAATLPAPLQPDAQATIQLNYTVWVPNIANRFGYQNDTYALGNVLVTPAVYDESGWALQPYVDLGDAFYTDIANYTVRIDVPDGYVVAATGEELPDGTFSAQNVRDFAFCASPDYRVLEGEQNGVQLRVYYEENMPLTAQSTLENAKKSIAMCEEHFGPYPYPVLNFAINELASGVGGMEYPMLVMMSPVWSLDELESEDVDEEERAYEIAYYNTCVCHEIGHQWFYGIVGNNQVEEPWLDEGTCRFIEYLYQIEGHNPAIEQFDLADRFALRHEMVTGQDPNVAKDSIPLNGSLYHFMEQDPMGYSEIYEKGATLLWRMRLQMGDDAFDQAMREYVDEFAYRTVTTQDFQQFWNTKADFADLFDLYFRWEEPVLPDPSDDSQYTKPMQPLYTNAMVSFHETDDDDFMTGYTLTAPKKTTVAGCLQDFEMRDGATVQILAPDGTPALHSDPLATGQRIVLMDDGAPVLDAVIVVQGDVLGTGQMSLAQVVRMGLAYSGANPLTGPFLQAATAETGAQVTLSDLVSQANAYMQTLLEL